MRIVLASASPRRKELLGMMGITDFDVIPARGEEKIPAGAAPEEIVRALAGAKAREVAAGCGSDDVIIAADTIVFMDGAVYGKPRSETEAFEMLRSLSGSEHRVYTSVCVMRGGEELCEAEESLVRFRGLSDGEIRAYIATGEPMDKAGAYGIQGRACVFVSRIEGDYYNIVGLPVCRLGEMLKKLGVGTI